MTPGLKAQRLASVPDLILYILSCKLTRKTYCARTLLGEMKTRKPVS